MRENKKLKYISVDNYEEIIKTNLCRYFGRYVILKNIYSPKRNHLWIYKLSEEYIHFEANVKNKETVDYKIKWRTYLAVMANQNLN